MVELVSSPNKTTVLIATKALAVVCRNSPKNQSLAIEQDLLTKCIELLAGDLDMYTAKWVILVMNALVYDNPAVRRCILHLTSGILLWTLSEGLLLPHCVLLHCALRRTHRTLLGKV